ncbi:MAG: ribonuclease P protein component [Flavobacteriales bacterium]
MQQATQRNTLCKDERLSRRKIIESVHASGSSIKSPAIILVYLPCELPVDFPAQAMFSASKRLFKRAHDRNRVKRLLREAYRKQKHGVYTSLKARNQQYALHFIFTGKQLPNYPYVFGKMNDLMIRFCNEIAQKPESPTIRP